MSNFDLATARSSEKAEDQQPPAEVDVLFEKPTKPEHQAAIARPAERAQSSPRFQRLEPKPKPADEQDCLRQPVDAPRLPSKPIETIPVDQPPETAKASEEPPRAAVEAEPDTNVVKAKPEPGSSDEFSAALTMAAMPARVALTCCGMPEVSSRTR